jgi:hypothetical protein
MTLAVNIAQGGSNNVTFRNRIINGACVIDQRNAGASITPTNQQYGIDRWQYSLSQSSKLTAQQSTTAPSGFKNSNLITSSSAYSVGASEVFLFRQKIEGYNVADLGWGAVGAQAVTVSFWVRSSLTGTFGGAVRNENQDRSFPFSYTISVANTWEQKTVAVSGDTSGTWVTNNGTGLELAFSMGSGSTVSNTAGSWYAGSYASATGAVSVVGTNGATFYITGVQLEAGTTASPFEYRQYGTELALCYRYFYKSNPENASRSGNAWGSMYTTNSAALQGLFPVTMRTAPSVTRGGTNNTFYISNINGASSGTDQNYGIATTTYSFEVVSLSGGAIGYPVEYNGQLSWSAEL